MDVSGVVEKTADDASFFTDHPLAKERIARIHEVINDC